MGQAYSHINQQFNKFISSLILNLCYNQPELDSVARRYFATVLEMAASYVVLPARQRAFSNLYFDSKPSRKYPRSRITT